MEHIVEVEQAVPPQALLHQPRSINVRAYTCGPLGNRIVVAPVEEPPHELDTQDAVDCKEHEAEKHDVGHRGDGREQGGHDQAQPLEPANCAQRSEKLDQPYGLDNGEIFQVERDANTRCCDCEKVYPVPHAAKVAPRVQAQAHSHYLEEALHGKEDIEAEIGGVKDLAQG